MKPNNKSALPVMISLALCSGYVHASDSFQQGDLALAFYQIVNNVVQNNTYVVNLGQASLYRENTQNNVPISTVNPGIASSNIKADLDATFGTNWPNDGTVIWLLVGGVASTVDRDPISLPVPAPGTHPINGDPARTGYISRPRASLNSNSTAAGTSITSLSASNRALFSNNVMPFLVGGSEAINGLNGNTSTSGLNLAGAIIPIASRDAVDSYVPPATTTVFGLGNSNYNMRQTLNAGPIGGTAEVEGALDIYRIIDTIVDADLTAGASSGNAVVGAGQFIGTLTLGADGELKITSVAAASASGFASWGTTNGATGQAASLDHDNDNVPNGVEYFIGGPTGNTTGFTPLPGVVTAGTSQSVTWTKAASYTGVYGTDFVVETSTTLDANSWSTEILSPNPGSTVVISGNNVTFTFPAGPVKKFARLRVIATP